MITYKQVSVKVSCKDYKDLQDKLNKLNTTADMPIHITKTTPNATDTNQWYNVNYWTQTKDKHI